jgi:hypothetical protein
VNPNSNLLKLLPNPGDCFYPCPGGIIECTGVRVSPIFHDLNKLGNTDIIKIYEKTEGELNFWFKGCELKSTQRIGNLSDPTVLFEDGVYKIDKMLLALKEVKMETQYGVKSGTATFSFTFI